MPPIKTVGMKTAARIKATAVTGPNCISAVVEQVVYRGFISHAYLRLDNGETMISFQTGASSSAGIVPGARVLARWGEGDNHVVRDDDAD